jgi:hypothetical protein
VLPHDFLEAALDLANSSRGKPKQAHLRRAVSTTYYAMFHALARCCADLFIGGTGTGRSKEAWTQVYRALDHGFAKSACTNKATLTKFPKEIQEIFLSRCSLNATMPTTIQMERFLNPQS